MIARIWTGQTRAADADAYAGYLARTGFPDYRSTPGNRGLLALRRVEDDRATFTLVTMWDSMHAIRAFAGDDPKRAKYYEQDEDFLLSLPERVTHYDVISWPEAAR